MVEFAKFRRPRAINIVDPYEIFLRLPKPPGIDDLWQSQHEALRAWHKRRTEQDIVIKLNTGGGKTLVGLLIAQSLIAELEGPVLYLCPTRQLRDQIVEQSANYGISTVPYVSGIDIPDEFLANKSVLIATYQALFNGRSKFGVTGGNTSPIELQGIIFDDAHTAFSSMREIFSLELKKQEFPDLYQELTTEFRSDFSSQGRQGTFDDVVNERDDSVLEVSYEGWLNRAEEIREKISELGSDKFPFVWPLIRDSFEHCHALISEDRFVITPLLPNVDMFPSFNGCPRRVYMSATVADDSSIIRTFDANRESVSRPITPTSLAGVGERMIIAPQLMKLSESERETCPEDLASKISTNAGVVILTPSIASAKPYEGFATLAQGEEVGVAVRKLNDGSCMGPYVFPNRYDGIDLPADSCRLLIMAGLPRGTNVYDLYRESVLHGSGPVEATMAQKIEQGIGRGTRGSGDHCVVLLIGKDLVSWVSLKTNNELLTTSTRAQVKMGIDTSAEIDSIDLLYETVEQCLKRAPDWTEYHANELADATSRNLVDQENLNIAAAERSYFADVRRRRFDHAAQELEDFVFAQQEMDPKMKGWLLQLAARAAHQYNDSERSDRLQRDAHGCNYNLLRPAAQIAYQPLSQHSSQAEKIVNNIEGFSHPKAALAEFDTNADYLVGSATTNQFEQALKVLGDILGFESSRPDNELGIGPDVLWLLNEKTAWVMEVKSDKKTANALSKTEHGQLLSAMEWFNSHYAQHHGVRIVVHPNSVATQSVTIGQTRALTLSRLKELIGTTRTLLEDLTSERRPTDQLIAQCEARLKGLSLTPQGISSAFLTPFTTA